MLGAEPLTGLLPLSMDLAAGSLKRSPIRKQKPSEKNKVKHQFLSRTTGC